MIFDNFPFQSILDLLKLGRGPQPWAPAARAAPHARCLRVEHLEQRRLLAVLFSEFEDPHPAEFNRFGESVVPLSNGNVVITSPGDDAGDGVGDDTDAGAVYLFNGSTGKPISTLTGSQAGDAIGSGGVTPLPNGNFVVKSPLWDNGAIRNAGAVTWVNGDTRLDGVVSVGNSLVGSSENDRVGDGGGHDPVVLLTGPNAGNFVVFSVQWNHGGVVDAGAATWVNGSTGINGVIDSGNSLVGDRDADSVGGNLIVPLTNGNYVVASGSWHSGSGAVTWGNGATGTAGVVNDSNSLVGRLVRPDLIIFSTDSVGSESVVPLPNGNYVVPSSGWDGSDSFSDIDFGAVTFGKGGAGDPRLVGQVSSSNSLVGKRFGDRVGSGGVTVLSNGNYVVKSPAWDFTSLVTAPVPDVGAVTWGSGVNGVTDLVSTSNSLIGVNRDDQVGLGGVTALTNGHYVVSSYAWDNGPDDADEDFGAVTWMDGSVASVGTVRASNSLVGSRSFDQVGNFGITALNNGNYVVNSPTWSSATAEFVGAVTWVNGANGHLKNEPGRNAVVSASNSLVGSTAFDQVGSRGVTALTNGNYVVASPQWNAPGTPDKDRAGAVTWGSGTLGIAGSVSATNSLIGHLADDQVGSSGVTALTNGNYVVGSSSWKDPTGAPLGAATFADGTTALIDEVTSGNSLIGNRPFDRVGSAVVALTNGNYVVHSADWSNGPEFGAGAVTWADGATGRVNGETGKNAVVSPSNSLVGSSASDQVGGGEGGRSGSITPLPNGNYLVRSSNWQNPAGPHSRAGAVTFGDGTAGVKGPIDATNSVFGLTAFTNLQPVVLDPVNDTFMGRFVNENDPVGGPMGGPVGGRVRVGSLGGTLSATLDAGVLTVADEHATGKNNNLTVIKNGSNLVITDAVESFIAGTVGSLSNSNRTLTIPLASLPGGLVIEGRGGGDALKIDLAGGSNFPANRLAFHGGTDASDTLRVTGNSAELVLHRFTIANQGEVNVDGLAVNYTGVESLADDVTAVNFRNFFFLSGINETIALSDTAGPKMTIDSDFGPSIEFAMPALQLDLFGGTTLNILGTDGSPRLFVVHVGTINITGPVTAIDRLWLSADTMSFSPGASLNAGNNVVLLTSQTPGHPINLGSEVEGSLSLTDDELDRITAGTVEIGNSGALTVSADISQPAKNLVFVTGAVVGVGGSGDISNDSLVPVTVTFRQSGDSTYSGRLGGNLAFTKQGNGKLTLTGSSTYTGATTIGEGTLSIPAIADGGVNSPIGASTNSAANLLLQLGTLEYTGSGHSTDRLFRRAGPNTTIAANGSGELVFTNTEATEAGSFLFDEDTFTLTGSGRATLRPDLTSTNNGVSVGLYLNKSGTGTWTLEGDNQRQFLTRVNDGQLNVNGRHFSGFVVDEPLTVELMGTLGGTGQIFGGVRVAADGKLAPGTSPGKLTVDDVEFMAGAKYVVEIGGTSPATSPATVTGFHDQLKINGLVSIDPSAILMVNAFDDGSGAPFVPALGQTFTIIDSNNHLHLTGTFFNLPEGALITSFLGSPFSARISYLNGDVTLTLENQPPTAIALSPATVPENQATGAIVGMFTATDGDAGDTFSYALIPNVTGANDNDLFEIVGDSLRTSAVLNFEVQASYVIRVEVTDSGGLKLASMFTVTATDVNDPPTGIRLSETTVDEGVPAGTVVADLGTIDEDRDDTFTYGLLDSLGDNDIGSFEIDGSRLKILVSPTLAKGFYSIRVRTTDRQGAAFDRPFEIFVNDVNHRPTDITIDNAAVAENEPAGTAVGILSAVDTDAGETFMYALVEGVGDNGLFSILGNSLQTSASLNFEAQTNYFIHVEVTDSDGLTLVETFLIVATDANDRPTEATLFPTTIDENIVASAIGEFRAIDEDRPVDAFVFTLIAGAGDTDNDRFTINGDRLAILESPNFEVQDRYFIRVQTDDQQGGTLESTLAIAVNNRNDAPTGLALSPTAIRETAASPIVGAFSTTDEDQGNAFFYSLVPGAGDTDNASFSIDTSGQLTITTAPDFETQSSYSIRVQTNDGQGGTFARAFTITVDDGNERPTGITIDNGTVVENAPPDTLVGILNTLDQDAGETFDYVFVAGAGDVDNGRFTIVGNQLRTNAVFDFETKSSYSIRIRSTDQGGLFVDLPFTITVLNLPETRRVYLVAGADVPAPPHVKVYDAETNQERASFYAYSPDLRTGVRVATADVTGDGIPDIITALGRSGRPHVKVFDGETFAEIFSFFAYEEAFTGGVFVAATDVDGDGRADIITGADAGGGPHVKVFSGRTGELLHSFFAFDGAFIGGARVAAGDLNGDGRADIVVAAGPLGGPHVKAFSGHDLSLIASFYAYEPAFGGGVFVAVGDINDDQHADMITGAGEGGGPHVRAFSGPTGAELVSFMAFPETFGGGVRVALAARRAGSPPELVVAAGEAGDAQVATYLANTLARTASFTAFDRFSRGVFVAGSVMPAPAAAPPSNTAQAAAVDQVFSLLAINESLEELLANLSAEPAGIVDIANLELVVGAPTPVAAAPELVIRQLDRIRAAALGDWEPLIESGLPRETWGLTAAIDC